MASTTPTPLFFSYWSGIRSSRKHLVGCASSILTTCPPVSYYSIFSVCFSRNFIYSIPPGFFYSLLHLILFICLLRGLRLLLFACIFVSYTLIYPFCYLFLICHQSPKDELALFYEPVLFSPFLPSVLLTSFAFAIFILLLYDSCCIWLLIKQNHLYSALVFATFGICLVSWNVFQLYYTVFT